MSSSNIIFNKHKLFALWAIVALLLLMPIAKAQHLAEHDLFVDEIHCKTCCSAAYTGLANLSTPLIVDVSPQLHSSVSPYISEAIQIESPCYHSRAPPKF
ncbi:hypothetical protein AADZ86_11060 [Colwelliaceae bacterium BS250]